MLRGVDFDPGYFADSRVVHLTRSSLLTDALCGELLTFHGEPDLAVICEQCNRLETPVATRTHASPSRSSRSRSVR